MLIAYDLRFAADHFTGIGTHAFALLDALLTRRGDERFAVLWNPRLTARRYDVKVFASHPRVRWCERAIAPLAPWSAWQMGAWLRDIRPDVYLSPYFILPEGAPCPSVLTVHDVHPLRRSEELPGVRGLLYRFLMARAARARFLITSSAFSRREIEELVRTPRDRVRAIRLGTPPRVTSAAPRRPAALPEGPYALVVGDNRPRKNLATLARAWARLGPDAPLRLVGAGPVLPRFDPLDRLAGDAGAPAVTALGWVDEAEMEWLYAHATLVLFPSLYEGFGFPLVEAFARGLATIAADIPPLREIGEGAAVFVAPEDPEAWAAAVHRLAADAGERDRMRTAAEARSRALDYAHTAAATLAVLREAAGVDTPHGRG